MTRYERWTAIISAGLIFGALLACKKKGSEATSEASASAAVVAPPPPEPAQTAVPTESPKLGDVKRYADKEKKSDEAAVRVLTPDVKVFNEADSKTPEVATLPKDALVFRLAEVDGFQLVEFPSGVGQFAQGWVEKTGLSDKPEKVARAAVLSDKKVATVKTDGGVKAVASSTAKDGGAADAAADAAAKPLTDAEKLKEAEKRAAEAEAAAAKEKEQRQAAEKRQRALERQRAANADAGKK